MLVPRARRSIIVLSIVLAAVLALVAGICFPGSHHVGHHHGGALTLCLGMLATIASVVPVIGLVIAGWMRIVLATPAPFAALLVLEPPPKTASAV